MIGSKRTRPFEYVEGGFGPGPSKLAKEDTAAIYEATLQKLQQGARAAFATASRCATISESPQPLLNPPPKTIPQFNTNENSNFTADSSAPMQESPSPSPPAGGSQAFFKDFALPRVSSNGGSKRSGRPSCYECNFRAARSACSHCSRACCEVCCRRCECCQELFCSVCSRVDYEERHERSFCFDCGAGARAAARARGTGLVCRPRPVVFYSEEEDTDFMG